MDYESAQQAAERLGVTVKVISKWAGEGRIVGAERRGNAWRIPVDFMPDEHYEGPLNPVRTFDAGKEPFEHMAMPLLNSSYTVGQCRAFIDSLPDEDDRAIALGEYYYFSGQAELAAKAMEPYQNSADPALRYSANLVGFFANFTLGRTHMAMNTFARLHADMQKDMQADTSPQLKAIAAMVMAASSVLLHINMEVSEDMSKYIACLPGGLKLWACYMMAHKEYLNHNYSGSLAMAELSLAISPKTFPIAEIYVRLVAAMDLMNLKRVDEARMHIARAWELAQGDGMIEPFGEHHGLLQGMIEQFFQDDYPKEFKSIIAITYAFSAGWRKIHLMMSDHEVADNLTTTEFSIAMLYNCGWTAKEIAAYMKHSPRTITNTIQTIYQKLGISNKRELGQYMLD